MKVSVHKLSLTTGVDRETITRRLYRARLAFEPGPKGAHMYDSEAALAVIYAEPEAKAPKVDSRADREYRKEMARLELRALINQGVATVNEA